MLEVYQLTNHLRLKKILILFDCYIGGVVNYVSEIWGTQKGQNVENLHLDF